MPASHVQVMPDSTGKDIDSQSLTSTETGTPTVYRQTITIGDSSTYGNIATVKAASTAIAATDNPLAIGIHPSSPLPTGTNNIGKMNPDTTSSPITLGALNAAATVAPNGAATVTWGVSNNSSFVGGVQFEGTVDGTNWAGLDTVYDNSSTWTPNSYTTNPVVGLVWRANASGWQQVRARVSTYTSGSIAVVTNTSYAAPGVITIGIPLPTGANTIGAITNTNLDVALSTRLKPADTLTGITTVAAVTAITNALPTGANTIGAVTNANLDVALSTRLKPADTLAGVTTVAAVTAITNALPTGANTIGAVTNTNLDVALSTRLKSADTLAGVTTVAAVTAITNALPTGANTVGNVGIVAGSAAIGTVGVNAALPTGANSIGGVTVEVNPSISGVNTAPLFAVINTATAASNPIVAANATKTIRVLSYTLIAGGTVNVTWQNATTALSGAMPLVANSGASASAPAGLFATSVNQALNLLSSAAVQVSGHCSYILV